MRRIASYTNAGHDPPRSDLRRPRAGRCDLEPRDMSAGIVRLSSPLLSERGSLEGTAPLPDVGGQPLSPALLTLRRCGCRTPKRRIVAVFPIVLAAVGAIAVERVKARPRLRLIHRPSRAGDREHCGRQIWGSLALEVRGLYQGPRASAVHRDCHHRPMSGALGLASEGARAHPAAARRSAQEARP